MSRVGRKPIALPKGIKLEIKGNLFSFTGTKGTLKYKHEPEVKVERSGETLVVTRIDESKRAKQMHGLTRALLQNLITGVTDGFEKTLEVIGVGFKIEQMGKGIMFDLGFSHSIYFSPPDGVKIEADVPKKKTNAAGTRDQLLIGTIKISGADKQLVGQCADKIRSFRTPDPYKSKGIRYSDERIRLKAGKTAA
jgi:large subunit ribosomal protein L6